MSPISEHASDMYASNASSSVDSFDPIERKRMRFNAEKLKIENKMGKKLYSKVYKFLVKNRKKEVSEEKL